MTRRASFYLLLIVVLGVLFNHLSWRERDQGYLLVVDEQAFDVIGKMHGSWNQLIRRCDRVSPVPPQSSLHRDIETLIRNYSPPGSRSAQIKTLLSMEHWFLVEVGFDDLLPAVVLIEYLQGEPHVISQAIWSGYTAPWESAPFIRQYLATKAPHAPIALVQCFDPEIRFLSP